MFYCISEVPETEDTADSYIENLDPELEALLKTSAPKTEHSPEKITVRLQYEHNYSTLSERTRTIAERLGKPMKLIIMDVKKV